MTYEAYSLQESASNACCSIQTYHLYLQIPNDLIELDIVELADSLLGFLPLSNLSRRYNQKKSSTKKEKEKTDFRKFSSNNWKKNKKKIYILCSLFFIYALIEEEI